MRTMLLGGAVMAVHVATVVGLYYLGISGDAYFAQYVGVLIRPIEDEKER
jgi:hypothetical protein